jgi:hypothetical protein
MLSGYGRPLKRVVHRRLVHSLHRLKCIGHSSSLIPGSTASEAKLKKPEFYIASARRWHFCLPPWNSSMENRPGRNRPVYSNALPFPCRGLGREGQENTDGREGKGREIYY